jgi:glycine/D-amino acid oxidase-like deaminating enzyme
MDERSRLLEQAQRCRRIAEKISDTDDYAGFIGLDPGGKNIYVTMGDSGKGLTHGVAGANLNTA